MDSVAAACFLAAVTRSRQVIEGATGGNAAAQGLTLDHFPSQR